MDREYDVLRLLGLVIAMVASGPVTTGLTLRLLDNTGAGSCALRGPRQPGH